MKKDTQCVHSGTCVDSQTKGLNTPIYTSSSFEYLDAPENVYPRYFNTPNQKSIIDNTFATPINQNPLDSGLDVVVHSGTRYIGGHSDICCGAALASRELIAKIKPAAANFGGSLNAMTCYLIERSLKTLGVRVARQNSNALMVARHLQANPLVRKVYYPGLESHPGFDIARKQMKNFGGMLSFELDATRMDPRRFLKNLELITPALSLGGVETIICAPVTTSHQKMTAEERAELGITDSLLRLSVGIEDVDDIKADIDQAAHIASS